MYVYDFFIYHLHPFGIATGAQELPKKLKKSEMDEYFKMTDVRDRAPDVTKPTKNKKKKKRKHSSTTTTTTKKPSDESKSSSYSQEEE